MVGFVVVSVLQVSWIRFFPPWPTMTMWSRKWEALGQHRSTAIDQRTVPRSAMADDVLRAVLAGEDSVFFEHHGFDWVEIQKAWRHNHRGGRLQGASTLTQQTAKNLFLWQGRSWFRKGLEAYYTVLLEAVVPKDRIFELYLNVAEWGDMTFGVEAAARRYFHKPAAQLSRYEAATLSACLPNPRKYPATGGSRFVERRRRIILRRMVDLAPGEESQVARDDDD